jgi:glutathione reductase (NADPH)
MTKKFDVIVIGRGSAASTVALRDREAGWQVAIVDARLFGGTCALTGYLDSSTTRALQLIP